VENDSKRLVDMVIEKVKFNGNNLPSCIGAPYIRVFKVELACAV
jgi:hypothetical protein